MRDRKCEARIILFSIQLYKSSLMYTSTFSVYTNQTRKWPSIQILSSIDRQKLITVSFYVYDVLTDREAVQ